MQQQPSYDVRRTAAAPRPQDDWSAGPWADATALNVDQFHPRSSDHRPVTQAKLLHDDATIYVLFRVQDRYVRCVHTTFQSMVSRDSCVEAFLEPPGGRGYLNFEFSGGGALLVFHIEDATPAEPGKGFFKKYVPLTEAQAAGVRVWHSLPARVEPEIAEAVTWTLGCAIPKAVFEQFVGPLPSLGGQGWRGNFFKCGDETSHPHWASWAPIGEKLRFHQPDKFAPVRFSK